MARWFNPRSATEPSSQKTSSCMANGLGAKFSTVASSAPVRVEMASPAMMTIDACAEPARLSISSKASPAPISPASAGAASPMAGNRPK